ncbi:hypothetical protein SESBI_38340 [Sesbania bispinosa]|nr:hypothetical protein SESBI_38340 [Sesbania bispinosa]
MDSWKHIQLTEDEEENVVQVEVPEEDTSADQTRRAQTIVCRLWTSQSFNSRAFKGTMINLWKTRHGLEIIDLDKNFFSICVFANRDRDLILNGCPWTFDKHVIVMEPLLPDASPSEWMRASTLCSSMVSKPANKPCPMNDHVAPKKLFVEEGSVALYPTNDHVAPKIVEQEVDVLQKLMEKVDLSTPILPKDTVSNTHKNNQEKENVEGSHVPCPIKGSDEAGRRWKRRARDRIQWATHHEELVSKKEKVFRFEKIWLDDSRFASCISNTWTRSGSNFLNKVKATKEALTLMEKEVGTHGRNLSRMEKKMKEAEQWDPSAENIQKRRVVGAV